MSRATRKGSIGTPVLKGRLGKIWALCRRGRPGYPKQREGRGTQWSSSLSLQWQVLHLSPRRLRWGLGEWRTAHRRRSGSRPHKEPEGAQVHRPDAVHLQVLRELAQEVAKLLSIVFENWGSPLKFPPTWKGNTNPSFSKREKKKTQGHLTLVP